MATSRFQTTQYSAEQFVESAGAILFHVANRQICLVYHEKRDEWLLAKGRRNTGEGRAKTALREAYEETGFLCDLLPLTMTTRAPPAVEEPGHRYPDEPRTHESVTEPFMVTCRQLEGDNNLKIIWWYIAAIRQSNEDNKIRKGPGEGNFRAALFPFDEALSKLTYKLDQDIVRKAVQIFQAEQ